MKEKRNRVTSVPTKAETNAGFVGNHKLIV